MFYTVIPIEDLLEGWEEEPPATVDIVVQGVLMQVEPLGNFSGRIVRIISSNPNDYIHPQYAPGSILNWT
jgi:hypothetical protein